MIKRRCKDTNTRKSGLPSARVSYKFAAYIHADAELALIWTKRLTNDINLHLFKTLDEAILDIVVQEELISL